MLVPTSTPQPVISRIHSDIVRIIRLPEMQERFAAEAGDVVASTPQEFGAFIASGLAKWGKVARESGAKVD